MAKFGVTTALVSIVLSAFMAGLGAGSWLAGVALRRYEDRVRFSPLRLYTPISVDGPVTESIALSPDGKHWCGARWL